MTDLTKEQKKIVDRYRKKMENAKTPAKRAALAKELGKLLGLPKPEDFLS